MENTDYKLVSDRKYRKNIANCAARFRKWRLEGKSLDDLPEYQENLDRNICFWGTSIYNDMTTKIEVRLSEAIICWNNSDDKTDEQWIRLFGKLFFNDCF